MAIWRYSVTCGLSGCYMPNSNFGPYSGTTRRELAGTIRDTLQMLDVAPSRARQVKLSRLWSFIKRHGSSTAHFNIDIGHGEELCFHGLTEAEYAEMSEAD
jgi:hypothetical protein